MTITLYDLSGKDRRRFSPFGWRSRMALAHKGLDHTVEHIRFSDKDKLAFSGQNLVPVLTDGDTVVADSFAIAEYLEDAYPDRPSLFGGASGRGMAKVINGFVDRTIMIHVGNLIVADVYQLVDPECADYFRTSREERFGKSLEEVVVGREDRVETFANHGNRSGAWSRSSLSLRATRRPMRISRCLACCNGGGARRPFHWSRRATRSTPGLSDFSISTTEKGARNRQRPDQKSLNTGAKSCQSTCRRHACPNSIRRPCRPNKRRSGTRSSPDRAGVWKGR